MPAPTRDVLYYIEIEVAATGKLRWLNSLKLDQWKRGSFVRLTDRVYVLSVYTVI